MKVGDVIRHEAHNYEVSHRARPLRENGKMVTVDESTYAHCDGTKVRGRGCKGHIVADRFTEPRSRV